MNFRPRNIAKYRRLEKVFLKEIYEHEQPCVCRTCCWLRKKALLGDKAIKKLPDPGTVGEEDSNLILNIFERAGAPVSYVDRQFILKIWISTTINEKERELKHLKNYNQRRLINGR